MKNSHDTVKVTSYLKWCLHCVINEALETPEACFDFSDLFVHIKQVQRKTGSKSLSMFFMLSMGNEST